MAEDFLNQVIGRPVSTITGKPVPTAQERMAPGKGFIDILSALLPGIGDVRDIGEAATGKDIFGEELTPFERILTGFAAMVPFIPGTIRKVPKMSKSLKDIYDEVFGKLPKKIQERVKIKSVKVGRFPFEHEGEGGRLFIDSKGDYHVVLEKGEEDLAGTLRHEILHAYELDYPTKGKRMDMFSEERAVHALEKELENVIELTEEMRVKKAHK
jgi:hypothetical protein